MENKKSLQDMSKEELIKAYERLSKELDICNLKRELEAKGLLKFKEEEEE